jgi:hypothetical protein
MHGEAFCRVLKARCGARGARRGAGAHGGEGGAGPAAAMVWGRAVKWSRGAERERERESWLPCGPGRGVGLRCNEREPTDR